MISFNRACIAVLLLLTTTYLSAQPVADILDYPVRADVSALADAHPVYSLLYNNVERYTGDEDSDALRRVVQNLAYKDYKPAAYALLPSYNPFDRNTTVITSKLKSPGGDNPVYWTALRLATEGAGTSNTYGHKIMGINYDATVGPYIPTNDEIYNFARKMEPKSRGDYVYRNNGLTQFGNMLIQSGLFE